MTDLSQLAPALLAVLGGVLQWARQFRAFRDAWTALIAVLLAGAAYLLLHVFTEGWRYELAVGAITVAGWTASVIGGTASAAAGSNVTKAIPRTDSK